MLENDNTTEIKNLPKLYAETRPPVIWMGETCCRRVEIWVDGYIITCISITRNSFSN